MFQTSTANRTIVRATLLLAVLTSSSAKAVAADNDAPSAFQVAVAGKGRPMILIPGLASSGDTWKTIGRIRGLWSTDRPVMGRAGPRAPRQHSTAARPNQLWVADFTYVATSAALSTSRW